VDRLRIGFAGVWYDCFDEGLSRKLYQASVRALTALGNEWGFELVAAPDVTNDVATCVAFRDSLRTAQIDMMLLQSCSFAAGEIVAAFADLNVPIGLWGMPEPETTGGPLRLNSLCGVNLYAGILGTYLAERDVKYKWYFGLPDSTLFLDRFDPTIRALKAIKMLDGAKFANIGGTPEGYYDVYWNDGRLRSKFDITVDRHELTEILARADALPETEAAKVSAEIQAEVPSEGVTAEEFMKLARVYTVFQRLIEENGYTGVGIACWPHFQTLYGLTACTTLGRLNEKGHIAACEGDIPSAISMAILKAMGGDRPVLMDLSALDPDDDSILLWHCGVGHPCWTDNCIQCRHSIIDAPRDDGGSGPAPAAFDMVLKRTPFTLMRLTDGGNRLLLATGETLGNRKASPRGTRGWASGFKMRGEEPVSALEFVNTVVVNGFEHHFPLAMGDLSEAVLEFAAWMDIAPLETIPYRAYLQRRSW
jgi:L-fucose isomerase-like protein